MKLNKKTLVILILGCIPAIFSLLQPGFFPSHDGEWMIIRLSDFHRSLADGQFPVRWAGRLNFGYGYPVFNFLYPGTFYLAEFIHLFRFNFIDSVKILFGLSIFLSGAGMYLLMKKFVGTIAAVCAALVYVYTPYRFVDVYVRGSLGESVAFVFLPLIFLGMTNLMLSEKKHVWFVFSAVTMAALILSHNVIAYLFFPIAFLYHCFLWYFFPKGNFNNKYLIALPILALGLSCFFWLPAILEKKYTIFDQIIVADYRLNFPQLKDLFIPSWNFGPSSPGFSDSMSMQIGIVNLIAIFFSAIFAFLVNKHLRRLIVFLLVVFFFSFFLMQRISDPFWQVIPLLKVIQFPWRILAITTFISSILFGLCLFKLKFNQYVTVFLCFGLLLFINFPYLKPQSFVHFPESYYATNDASTTVQNEYLPVWSKGKTLPRVNKIEIVSGSGQISGIKIKSNYVGFGFKSQGAVLKINTMFYPGWELMINAKKADFNIDNNGLIRFWVSKGDQKIELFFKETPLRKFANLVTVLSGLFCGYWLFRKKSYSRI